MTQTDPTRKRYAQPDSDTTPMTWRRIAVELLAVAVATGMIHALSIAALLAVQYGGVPPSDVFSGSVPFAFFALTVLLTAVTTPVVYLYLFGFTRPQRLDNYQFLAGLYAAYIFPLSLLYLFYGGHSMSSFVEILAHSAILTAFTDDIVKPLVFETDRGGE